ncbi:putative argonaute linker 2 domain-containing protein [Helianthus annuus]|nr:putative argonaute linker 2 domain-containing protein [Helianthus annuus]
MSDILLLFLRSHVSAPRKEKGIFSRLVFSIVTFRHNAYGQVPYAKEFGIKICTQLASVEAWILPPPRVYERALFNVFKHFSPFAKYFICLFSLSTMTPAAKGTACVKLAVGLTIFSYRRSIISSVSWLIAALTGTNTPASLLVLQ